MNSLTLVSSPNWRTECPLLATFLDSALWINSGSTLKGVPKATIGELTQAEEELMALCGESNPVGEAEINRAHWLGAVADSGYTMCLSDMGSKPFTELKCYKILDREY